MNKVRQEEQTAANERNFQFAQDANREMHGRAAVANKALGAQMVARASGRGIISDAELAGFNPVTWLTSMGAMYQQMNGMGYELQVEVPFTEQAFQGSAYMMNAPTAQVPSMMETIGNAASAGWNAYRSDERLQQSQDFQREMLYTQLNARGNSVPGWGTATGPVIAQSFFGSGNLPYSITAGSSVVGDAMGRAKPATIPIGLSGWKPGDVEVTSPWQDRSDVAPVADAETWVKRYGESEIVEMAAGAKTMLDDLSWSWNRRSFALGFKQNWRDLFGYPVYPDGARGLSWGLPYDQRTFGGEGFTTGAQF